ncbi:putative regulatory protein, FmdB family [Longilinea arvoryzae]|uniref:Putative regulatory protein, FmdB family n=1 Tax=Longilinea arvoryzae TaxID=360412 RepID=A0A0S7BJG3_9CHLR|nr:zinc ribbon domain-containing protein [Longilinea arvoryzae]GAP14614.1 putative regulatory protein, FmdB family [Longilinea arvoryzae]
MPVYQFECDICGKQFERRLPISHADEMPACPAGHQAVHRVYSVPVVVYKGSGFYSTDHRKSTSSSSK